jgi:hypothetical protein
MGEAARALNIPFQSISAYFIKNRKKPYKGQYTFKKLELYLWKRQVFCFALPFAYISSAKSMPLLCSIVFPYMYPYMLTKYVYNTTNELTLLSIPWFVTGFTDAE